MEMQEITEEETLLSQLGCMGWFHLWTPASTERKFSYVSCSAWYTFELY